MLIIEKEIKQVNEKRYTNYFICTIINDKKYRVPIQIKTATPAELLRIRNGLYKIDTNDIGIEIVRLNLIAEIKEILNGNQCNNRCNR